MITQISHSEVDYTSPMVKLVNKLLTHKGEKETLRLLKAYRLYLTQIVLRQNVEPLKFTKVTKKGFPIVLCP